MDICQTTMAVFRLATHPNVKLHEHRVL